MSLRPHGRFGRYRVDRRIGAGGMSQAWRGQLEGLGGFRKLVVIKLLHPEHVDDPEFVRMFMDEARLTARLSHPNIAQVYEAGVQDELPFLAMEYIAGPDLTHVVKRLRGNADRPYGVAARLFSGVARGLAAAHTATDEDGRPLQIVHRDVSLGNIVVARDGAAKLIDFGIARWQEKSTVTEVGLLKGKLHYMAPEQLEPGYDHRVDIYQAGVCLYWLTTGRPPYHSADPLQIWRDRLAGKAPKPTELVHGYPPALERIVLKALARDPARRYLRASDFARDLERFCDSGGRWQTGDRDVVEYIESLFTDDELGEWRPARAELERTDPSGTARVVADYEGDDETAGARTIRALDQGRYLTADSLAGDIVSAADAAPLEPVEETRPDRTPKTAAPPEPLPRRSAARPVVRSAARPASTSASTIRPWVGVLLAVGFVLAGIVGGMGLAQRAAGPSPDEVARVYVEEAVHLAEGGDTAGALEMLGKARAAGPTDPRLDIEIGRLERVLTAP